MDSAKRAILLALASSLLLPNCMPDFNALSLETGSAGMTQTGGAAGASGGAVSGASAAGNSFGGSSAVGGVSAGTAGQPADLEAGSGTVSGAGGIAGGAGAGGKAAGGGAGVGGRAGAGGGAGASGGTGATGGAGGAGGGGAPSCPTSPVGATAYATFDHSDLLGPGFVDGSSAATMDTTKGATASWAWDAAVGNSCPGALRFTFAFSEYVSGTPVEMGSGFYYFAHVDWSNWSALHVMVKVSPNNAPITDVRLFVISGSQYSFHSTTDTSKFKTGTWNDLVLQLAGSDYVASDVSQIGVQAVLDAAGTSGIPATPPTVNVWLDDIWLEPK